MLVNPRSYGTTDPAHIDSAKRGMATLVILPFPNLDPFFGSVVPFPIPATVTVQPDQIPEPATLAFMDRGLAGIGYRQRHSKIAD